MDNLDLRGFNLFPTKVTFESLRPHESEEGPPIPQVKVGYKGKPRAMLFQHVGAHVNPDGIKPGEWFALSLVSDNPTYSKDLISRQPISGTLEEMKKCVEKIILQHYGT